MRKKDVAIWSVGLAVLAIAVFLVVNNSTAAAQRYPADAYRDGQEQFIQLIGEEEFTRFEHGHPPLNCTETDWQEHPLSCSETWLHRFEIAQILNPSDFEEGEPRDTEPIVPGEPTAVPKE